MDKASYNLPPRIGQVGSIVFFLCLFWLAQPDLSGYNEFRKCHSNCLNGVLHGLLMPPAVSGVFLIVRSVSNNSAFTRQLQIVVTTAYLGLYLRYEASQFSPWLFFAIYLGIFELILYQSLFLSDWRRTQYLILGVTLVAVNVSTLEVVGHGVLEHHHSHVSEFFNSVFHTPLYGINSIMMYLGAEKRDDHACW